MFSVLGLGFSASATGTTDFGVTEDRGLGLAKLAGEPTGFAADFSLSEVSFGAAGLSETAGLLGAAALLLMGATLAGLGFAAELTELVAAGFSAT